MYLKLIFQDLARPSHDLVIAQGEAEVNYAGIRNGHIGLIDVPVTGLCPRLELRLTESGKTFSTRLANLADSRPQMDKQYTHKLYLRDRKATLSDCLNVIAAQLAPAVDTENLMVTAQSYPLNGAFEGSVRIIEGEWRTQHNPPYVLRDLIAPSTHFSTYSLNR